MNKTTLILVTLLAAQVVLFVINAFTDINPFFVFIPFYIVILILLVSFFGYKISKWVEESEKTEPINIYKEVTIEFYKPNEPDFLPLESSGNGVRNAIDNAVEKHGKDILQLAIRIKKN
jgi:amino acid permease